MTKKLETALKLMDDPNESKRFQGWCLLLEIRQATPEALDPVSRTLIDQALTPLLKSIEKHMGIQVLPEEKKNEVSDSRGEAEDGTITRDICGTQGLRGSA